MRQNLGRGLLSLAVAYSVLGGAVLAANYAMDDAELLGPNPPRVIDLEYIPGAAPASQPASTKPATLAPAAPARAAKPDRAGQAASDNGRWAIASGVLLAGSALAAAALGFLLTRISFGGREPRQKMPIAPRPPL